MSYTSSLIMSWQHFFLNYKEPYNKAQKTSHFASKGYDWDINHIFYDSRFSVKTAEYFLLFRPEKCHGSSAEARGGDSIHWRRKQMISFNGDVFLVRCSNDVFWPYWKKLAYLYDVFDDVCWRPFNLKTELLVECRTLLFCLKRVIINITREWYVPRISRICTRDIPGIS